MEYVRMPQPSANVLEARITEWFANEGDAVTAGEPLLEVTTDKAAIEVAAPATGILRRIVAPVKSTLPTGTIVAIIAGLDEVLQDVDSENAEIMARHRQEFIATDQPVQKKKRSKVKATPAARRRARELEIDLNTIPTGDDDTVVTEVMVERFAANGKSE